MCPCALLYQEMLDIWRDAVLKSGFLNDCTTLKVWREQRTQIFSGFPSEWCECGWSMRKHSGWRASPTICLGFQVYLFSGASGIKWESPAWLEINTTFYTQHLECLVPWRLSGSPPAMPSWWTERIYPTPLAWVSLQSLLWPVDWGMCRERKGLK